MALSPNQVQSLKLVDIKTRLLVNGFIRHAQSLLTNDNQIISDIVVSSCILFCFHWQWDSENIGDFTKIMDDKSIVRINDDKLTQNKTQSVFLTTTITISKDDKNSSNHAWKFGLLEFENAWMYNLVIGLWDIKHEPNLNEAVNETWNTETKRKYALVATTGDFVTPDTDAWGEKVIDDYNKFKPYQSGDVIEMYLNGNVLGFKKERNRYRY